MAKNRLSDLRNHLFAQLESLRDAEAGALDVEISRAKAVASIGGKIIDAAKTELKYLESIGAEASEFWDTPKTPERSQLPHGANGKALSN